MLVLILISLNKLNKYRRYLCDLWNRLVLKRRNNFIYPLFAIGLGGYNSNLVFHLTSIKYFRRITLVFKNIKFCEINAVITFTPPMAFVNTLKFYIVFSIVLAILGLRLFLLLVLSVCNDNYLSVTLSKNLKNIKKDKNIIVPIMNYTKKLGRGDILLRIITIIKIIIFILQNTL